MGDRGLLLIHFPEPFGSDLGLYTHWEGSDLPNLVREIVQSNNFKRRIGDHTYACRILVDQVTKSGRDDEAGFGLFPLPQGANPEDFSDNSHPIVHVNIATGDVSVGEYDPRGSDADPESAFEALSPGLRDALRNDITHLGDLASAVRSENKGDFAQALDFHVEGLQSLLDDEEEN